MDGWMINLEEDVRRKLGETQYQRAARTVSLLVVYLLTGAFLVLAIGVMGRESRTTALIGAVVIVFVAAAVNHHHAHKDQVGVRSESTFI